MSSMTEKTLGDKKLLFSPDTEVLLICRSQTNRIMCTTAIDCPWTTGVLDWLWFALHQVRSWWEGWKICQDRARIGRETWSSYAYWTVSLYTFRPCYTILHIPFLKVSSEICSEDQVGVAWEGFVRVQVISNHLIKTCLMSFGRQGARKSSVVEPWAFEWLLLLPDTCDSGSRKSWAHGTCMLQDQLSHLTCDTAILKTTPFLHKGNWEWNCMFKHVEAYLSYIRQGGAVSIWTKVSHRLSILRYSPGAFASVRPCSGGRMPGQGSPDLFGDSIDGRMVLYVEQHTEAQLQDSGCHQCRTRVRR